MPIAMEKAIDLVKKATEADNNKQYEEALPLYKQAIDYFLHALKYETHGERQRESVRAKCAQYLERAEQLKKYTKKKSKVSASGGGKGGGGGGGGGGKPSGSGKNKGSKYDDSDSDDDEAMAPLQGTIILEKPNIHWDDIAGLNVAKEALKETVILPVRFPHLFQTKHIKSWNGILLYGPPGTGKTYLTKAVATEAEATFFYVSSADLVSTRLGESKKLVKGLFDRARKSKPAIVFIDGVDLLCSARDVGSSGKEFLVQMQGVNNDGVFVFGATGLPWGLDAAIRRSFKKRICMPLPEENARISMFKIHIGTMFTTLIDNDYITLARNTEGYSGADIEELVQEAAMMPVRKVQTATHFKVVRGLSPTDKTVMRDDLLLPCAPSDPAGKEMNWMDIPGDRLKGPLLTMDDFMKALHNTPPTVNSEDLKQFEDWTKDFGQEG